MFTFNAPDRVKTSRLTLRLPDDDDAESVFAYASDPVATRYMSWPIHVNIEDTYAFFEFAEREWESSGIGPYLVVRGGAVIGSTGLQLAANGRIGTGYILARSEWGKGYGTEVCRAMVEVAQGEGIREIATYCHADHTASARVLEKAGFAFEGLKERHRYFPNKGPGKQDVRTYVWRATQGPAG